MTIGDRVVVLVNPDHRGVIREVQADGCLVIARDDGWVFPYDPHELELEQRWIAAWLESTVEYR